MPADQGPLWQLLKRVAKNDHRVTDAMRLLSPLFDTGGRGKFDLVSAHNADERSMIPALTKATHEQVKRVIFVSLGDDLKSCGQLDQDEVVLLRQGMNLGDSLWLAIWDKNRYWLAEGFKKGPGPDVGKKLENLLRGCLGVALENALAAAMKGSRNWQSHRACIGNGIWDCALYYVGYVAIGDKARAERLEPLLKLLPRMIPVCARKSQPGTWIVLIA
jgi:hypothetical protein